MQIRTRISFSCLMVNLSILLADLKAGRYSSRVEVDCSDSLSLMGFCFILSNFHLHLIDPCVVRMNPGS